MKWYFIAAAFFWGVTFGFPLGRYATVKVLGPLIHRMSKRIQELETQHIDQVLADDFDGMIDSISGEVQAEILEKILRSEK